MTDKISVAEAIKETKKQYGDTLKKLASGQDDDSKDSGEDDNEDKRSGK